MASYVNAAVDMCAQFEDIFGYLDPDKPRMKTDAEFEHVSRLVSRKDTFRFWWTLSVFTDCFGDDLCHISAIKPLPSPNCPHCYTDFFSGALADRTEGHMYESDHCPDCKYAWCAYRLWKNNWPDMFGTFVKVIKFVSDGFVRIIDGEVIPMRSGSCYIEMPLGMLHCLHRGAQSLLCAYTLWRDGRKRLGVMDDLLVPVRWDDNDVFRLGRLPLRVITVLGPRKTFFLKYIESCHAPEHAQQFLSPLCWPPAPKLGYVFTPYPFPFRSTNYKVLLQVRTVCRRDMFQLF
jgi:hypothetical protein